MAYFLACLLFLGSFPIGQLSPLKKQSLDHGRFSVSTSSLLAKIVSRLKFEENEVLSRKKRWEFTTFQVLENQRGRQKIAKLHSSFDDDSGNIRYSITGQGAGSLFQINPSTGELTVWHTLDREAQSFFQLNVSAKDLQGNEVENASAITIEVMDKNDNKPVFPNEEYHAFVKERSPIGTPVTKVIAEDRDDPDNPYGQIEYSILPSSGSENFMIHPYTGQVKTTSDLDRETVDTYELLIKAKDDPTSDLGYSATTTLIVTVSDVNDIRPLFINQPYTPAVPEDLGVGDEVFRIESKDADLGKNALSYYSIIGGRDANKFEIVTDENVGILKVKEPLDYETAPNHVYKLSISVKNIFPDPDLLLSPMEDTAGVSVHLTDVNEPPLFDQSQYTFSVSEDAIAGFPIQAVSATDPEGDSFSYSLEDDFDKFSIDRRYGMISVKGKLDRETRDHYMFVVRAGVPGSSSKVSVRIDIRDVNDNPPILLDGDKLELILCENYDEKTQKLSPNIRVTDRDDPEFNGAPFKFYPVNNPSSNHFKLVDNGDDTASLYTTHNKFYSYERKEYEVPIVVEDSGIPSKNASLSLKVLVCQCTENGSPLCDAVPQEAGIPLGILFVLLGVFVVLLVVVILLVTVRRRRKREDALIKESLSSSEEDVRENFISYNEEGGGEEDTDAFDLNALQRDYCSSSSGSQVKSRHDFSSPPSTKLSYLPPYNHCDAHLGPNAVSQDICDFIKDRKNVEDTDDRNLPFDSLQMYAYEGEGSDAGSLSSLCTSSDDNEHNYDYLREWGPRFSRLADMYGSGRSYNEGDSDGTLSGLSLQMNGRQLKKSRRTSPC